MKRRLLFWILALTLAWCGRDGARLHGQTRPRPEQIRNIEQVRISCGACDPRPATLVGSIQLQSGRSIQTPADGDKPTVCVVVFTRVAVTPETWPPHNIQRNSCYTQPGLIQLLADPAWLTWWLAHGGAPIVPMVGPGAQAVIDQLTHPRPLPRP
jgi:hypothetical protein